MSYGVIYGAENFPLSCADDGSLIGLRILVDQLFFSDEDIHWQSKYLYESWNSKDFELMLKQTKTD